MALLKRNTKNVQNRYWCSKWDNFGDSFPVKNRYTAGVAGQKFLKELKENGKIYGAYCPKCEITFVPAMLYCERCFEELDEWVDVGLIGTLEAYTVSRLNRDGTLKEKPSVIGAIRMGDGYIVHYLGECDLNEIENGMKVEASLRPQKERVGEILDIKYFKPSSKE